ncbi:nitrate/sulfonate/bicarbonate ABC transporter periplasmic protein [Halococcus hamelinensis 100A6]|uniref:Nitrate/sulfonate/bicarbonate ABC transporter periplasmic protein n=2 Tax=Halococcus hamelinensis TaxID=332168 RepID=M0M879_9EURY|nr:nitrate/sulfonate/bicarbonate ABC transporter periplasmic protein [Halococcus hamelinensis 100A6]
MQHFVMQEEGYYDELPNDVNVRQFSDGPSVVKAFASGDVDVAMFGISPTMVLTDRGVNANVLVPNSRNGFRVMATEAFASSYANDGADAFAAFREQNGRQVRFGVPPDGSVPDVITRYWIQEDLGLGDLGSVVEKVQIPPARAPQAIQSGDIDATMIQEPFATVIANESGFEEAAWSGDIFPGHPVTVMFVSDRVSSGTARSLVTQHIRATEFARNQPQAAADDAAAVIGSGVSSDLARRAIDSQASDFLSDPNEVTDQAATMAEFVSEVGNTDSVVSPSRLFDTSIYESVAEGSTTTR